MTFRLANVDGRAALTDAGYWFDLAALCGDVALADPMTAIAHFDELGSWAGALSTHAPSGALCDKRLRSPVPRPQKVFGIGLNYRAHATETGATLPPAPLTFTKFPSCLAGPTDDVVLSGNRVDWEVELVVVVGRGGRHIDAGDAWGHVAGLTLGQDISDRTVQRLGEPPQFCLGKSYDTYGPIGPVVVSVDAFADPDDIGLSCRVNDEMMQDARTSDLIFPVPELIAYLSSICTLEPGDLIFTGTPSGVGVARGRFLRSGDVITSSAEQIGSLVNRCAAAN